jgi:hypothetical protein
MNCLIERREFVRLKLAFTFSRDRIGNLARDLEIDWALG